jgi:membrane protease YdiL (CAAX protease family)
VRPTSLPDGRELAAFGVVFGTNAVVHRVLPHATHVPANLLAAGGVLALARTGGVGSDALGLDPRHVGSGLRAGAVAASVLAGTVCAAALVPAGRGHFADGRVTEVGTGRALYELLVRIPIGTALAEELLFRSAFTGLLARRRPWAAAMSISSFTFGLWHVLPTIESLDSHPAGARLSESAARATSGVIGVVATTAAAGVALALLQRRGRHVIAPVLAHAALNGTTYAVTRVLGHRR